MSSILRMMWSRGQIPVKYLVPSVRGISTSLIRSQKPTAPTETPTPKPASANPMDILQGSKNHKVDNLERRFLVWSGKYKRMEDVPPTVSQETMEKARNKARIKIANYIILATVVACIGFVYSGKQAAKRGESVQQMNLEWHRQMDIEAEKQEKKARN